MSESLIILLHTQTFEHTSIDAEWALVHALQLAEAGRTIKERRIGEPYRRIRCDQPTDEL